MQLLEHDRRKLKFSIAKVDFAQKIFGDLPFKVRISMQRVGIGENNEHDPMVPVADASTLVLASDAPAGVGCHRLVKLLPGVLSADSVKLRTNRYCFS